MEGPISPRDDVVEVEGELERANLRAEKVTLDNCELAGE